MRRSFAAFVRGGWSQLEGAPLQWGRHLDAICDTLQSMAEGWLVANRHAPLWMIERQVRAWQRHGLPFRGEDRLLVQNLVMNLPPGTLKSRLLMVFLPAWIWLHAPAFSLCAISGTPDNVKRDSHAHKQLVQSSWYRDTFGITWTISRTEDSVDVWATTAGGKRYSRGKTAPVTGLHVDALLYDDPDDAKKVHSEAERSTTQQTWTKAQENRTNSNDLSFRIINQQRVHTDDLSAYVLALGRWAPETDSSRRGWAQFAMPLEFGHGPKDVPEVTPWGWRDWRTVKGEVLHAVRFSIDYILDARVKFGSAGFEAQYNQNPGSEAAGWVKRAWVQFFRYEDERPELMRPRPDGCRPRGEAPAIVLARRKHTTRLDLQEIVISVDGTFGAKGTDASGFACPVYGRRGMAAFQLEAFSKPLGWMEAKAQMRDVVSRWGNCGVPMRCLVENKANGAPIVAELKAWMMGGELLGADGKPCIVVVQEVEPGNLDKRSRFQVAVPWAEAGMLFMHDGAPWIDEELEEVCGFPNARRDDRADALSQFVSESGLKAVRGYDPRALSVM